MKVYEIDQLRALRGKGSEYDQMMSAMVKEAEEFVNSFSDSPANLSEWGHNYFCPEDGERLIFDLNKPTTHECQLCHKVYKSQTLDNVWTYFYRNTAIVTLMKLALLYKVDGNPAHLEGYKTILGFYADHYNEFALHAKDKIIDDLTYDVGGAGRLMPQGLNEAIVLIRVVTSMEILKDDLEDTFVNHITEGLLKPASLILKPQLIRIHNIPCWLNAALGVVGLYTGDEALTDLVFNGEFGIYEQLRQGVTEDKFWYEGSIHYNFFLLEGVISLLMFTKIYDQPFKEEDTVRQMLKQAYDYAFDNDVFPNPNDGWPNMNLKSYEYIYCAATKIFGEDSEIGDIYKNILLNESPRKAFPLSKPYYYNNDISFERLLYFPNIDLTTAKPIKRGSVCFENSYFGLLKNKDINLFLKYGHRGPSHAHPDKMTIEVTIKDKMLTRDLSNSGYASVLCNEWHRTSLAHNTVIVDGQNQTSMEGGTVKRFDNQTCHTYVADVYEGVDYTRALNLSEEGFEDFFQVESNTEHVYDWVFHSQAALISNPETQEADLGFNDNGYQHVKEVERVVNPPKTMTLEWDLEGTKLSSSFDTEGKEVYLAKTYDNPASSYRTAIILREKSKHANFKVEWKIK